MHIRELEKAMAKWHKRKHGRTEVDLVATLEKLGEEYGELQGAIVGKQKSAEMVAFEIADMIFVLCHIARHYVGKGGLEEAIEDKLVEINRRLDNPWIAPVPGEQYQFVCCGGGRGGGKSKTKCLRCGDTGIVEYPCLGEVITGPCECQKETK
jgi:NTP pyrophosphatase (non-canonical NTP hydrolase)